ncbi:MAG: hypothetical protein N2643_03225 [Endomicrobia bacterium]|nr:hypothetical protein [Endomicrobiia bacterium]
MNHKITKLISCVLAISVILFSCSTKKKSSGGGSTGTQTYTLSVVINPTGAGSVSLNPAGGTYNAGTVVTLTATANTGYTFSSWAGDATGTTNPTTVTMNANKVVIANFTQSGGGGGGGGGTTYTLTVTVSPSGAGSVSLNPAGGTYNAGTVVTLTASANTGYTFSGWSGAVTGTSNPTTVTMDSNKSVTATFTTSGGGGGGGGADAAKYNFETTAQGWQAQTWIDSQGITAVARDTTKSKNGSASLKCTVNLQGGDEQTLPNTKGEAWVDMQNNPPAGVTVPVNLSNATVSVWVFLPAEAAGDPQKPNGIQIFFKDNTWKNRYSSWKNIGNPPYGLATDSWVEVTVNCATETWAYDESGFDMTKVRAIGVKIGTGGGSTATFSGNIWIDSVNW